MLKELGNLPP